MTLKFLIERFYIRLLWSDK